MGAKFFNKPDLKEIGLYFQLLVGIKKFPHPQTGDSNME
mgnify:CR=1 FL=1